MFSVRLLDHFQHPRNVGRLDPPAVRVEASNPVCGDQLELSVLIEDGRITQAVYKTRACTASIAAGSALTEILQGKTLAEAAKLQPNDIEQALDGLPNESKHAAALAIEAVRLLLAAANGPG